MTGALTIGTIGFGRPMVRGLNRDPSPPAMTTAFIVNPSSNHSQQLSCKFIIDHQMGSRIISGPVGKSSCGRIGLGTVHGKRVTFVD
jgi:hypothetical protein